MPGTGLRALQGSSHLIFTRSLQGACDVHPQITDEKAEPQKSEVTYKDWELASAWSMKARDKASRLIPSAMD